MKILAIESSCDETAASVVEMGESPRILSNIVASQTEIHRLYGGVVPEIASRAHIEAVSGITYEALTAANTPLSEIDAVAVTANPGLIGALLVGVNFAKSLAYANGIPLVPVNHVRAHTAAAYLTEDAPKPPFLSLVVSGGHTSIYHVTDYTTFREIGATRDDAAGESFDKVGRVMGLCYPGGAEMDRLAGLGTAGAVKLPSPALSDGSLDFSFSGLKTAAINHLHTCEQRGTPFSREDFAASFTETVVTAIASKMVAAVEETGVSTVVLAGGVAANSHLRRGLSEALAKAGARLIMPPLSLCGDNAAMVAAQGYYEFLAGNTAGTELNASAAD